MDWHVLASFALATLAETCTPGPTMALVLEARLSRGAPAANQSVFGITLANSVLVLALTLIGALGGASLVPIVRNIGAFLLVCFAASRFIAASIAMFFTTDSDTTPPSRAEYKTAITAFTVHFLNPLTFLYYVATFGAATAGKPAPMVIAFGAVAVLSDLAIYSFLANTKWRPFGALLEDRRFAGLLRLVVACALVFLVAQTFSSPTGSNGITTFMMLLGLLAGLLYEAHRRVQGRKERNNKLVWRAVGLWAAWFSIYAFCGAVYATLCGLTSSALGLEPQAESRVRICSVVAAAFAAALALAKISGELQDDLLPCSRDENAAAASWRTKPLYVGAVAFAYLLAVYCLLALTRFHLA